MDETMTAPEVAAAFKVTETTIYYWRKSGKLPSYKKGSRRVFLKKDVDRLLTKENHLSPGPEEMTAYELAMKAKGLYKLIKRDLTKEDKARLFDVNLGMDKTEAFIAELEKLVRKYKPKRAQIQMFRSTDDK